MSKCYGYSFIAVCGAVAVCGCTLMLAPASYRHHAQPSGELSFNDPRTIMKNMITNIVPPLPNCTKWFADIGCGYGVAAERFLKNYPENWSFNTASYPKHGKNQLDDDFRKRGFAKIFQDGAINNAQDFCFLGFDGNPFFQRKSVKREQEFQQRGMYAKFIAPAAISDKNGLVTFYLDTENTGVNYWGSSLWKTSKSVNGGKTPVTVPAYSLAGAFEMAGINPSDTVILHMNAEGGEFYAIP